MNKGYSMCLNEWALDKDIKSELGLLLIISSLTAQEGYCYANNKYFAKQFDVDEVTISRKIKKLEAKNYIKIEYKRKGAEIINRKIRLTKTSIYDKQKSQPTINKNVKENIINNNIINNKRKNKQEEIVCCSESRQIADFLLKNILKAKPNFVCENINRWIKDIDLAIRKDKRTVEQLKACIDWIYNTKEGNFWISNILSGKKLREKFDTMESQMMTRTKCRLYNQIKKSGLSARQIIAEQLKKEKEMA